jgi:hypothetical protein
MTNQRKAEPTVSLTLIRNPSVADLGRLFESLTGRRPTDGELADLKAALTADRSAPST